MSDYVTKDSGERARFNSGMQRDTEAGKARFDLLHPLDVPYKDQFLTRVAELMGRGAEKYDDRNWEKADSEAELARMKSSAFRHFMQWLAGETDEDHAAATVFNLLAHETTRFKIDSNALEVEDPLVDEAYVGADHTLLDRIVYWSKRLQRAQAEEPNPGDEIDYARENLQEVLDIAEDNDLEYVEVGPRGPLGEGWQSVGWVDETQEWPYASRWLDDYDRELHRYPYPLPFKVPTPILDSFADGVLTGEISWGDPKPRTLEASTEALAKIREAMDQPRVVEIPKVSLPDGQIGSYVGMPIFEKLDITPLVARLNQAAREAADRAAFARHGGWPVTVMCGVQDPQETIDAARAERRRDPEHAWDNSEVFVVDSNGVTELRSATSVALQVAFDRRP